ncbi:hypothetical protein A9Q88_05630 [Gammaproteobacteria bacterium 50_400_T64]|nr:hypothetical protein A9Q88_05630 [Gammaproteobacteria bacterium 50_400_T64]
MTEPSSKIPNTDYDVIIVGAGFGGLTALHRMRELGFSVRLFEAAPDVGGTWYWNQYPGLKVDVESIEYSLSFSHVVEQEWTWSERYSGPQELCRYANFVADRLDLRRDIQTGTRIDVAEFDEETGVWALSTSGGETLRSRFVIMCTGMLNQPIKPQFPGLDSFEGDQYHSARWPKEGVDFTGKRVGVIGTGSSGVQIISTIASEVGHLHVFHRTPGYCLPLRNHAMPEEYTTRVKANYGAWRAAERYNSFGGWVALNYEIGEPVTGSALDATPEEHQALFDERWKSGGLSFYNVYPDTYTDLEANAVLSKYLQAKIRERIKDPKLAEILTPKYPALTKRLIAETNYYEVYERDNVELVDLRENGIDEITPKGVRVGDTEYELDSLVFATGFDAMIGSLKAMDVRGRNGLTFSEHWDDGARTHMGLMSAGFPNLFIINAAGSPAPLFQPIILGQEQVQWVARLITKLAERNINCIEPTSEAEDTWGGLCEETVTATLFPLTDSWYLGKNVPGKSRTGLAYFGGMENYRKIMTDAEVGGYSDGFVLSTLPKAGN